MIDAWGDPLAMFQLISSLVATAACALLIYRILSTYDDLTLLTVLLAGALAGSLLLGALLTIEISMAGIVIYTGVPLFLFRLFALGLGVSWHFWLHASLERRSSTGRSTAVETPSPCG